MNRIVLACFASGLLGSMFGAGVVSWVHRNEAPQPSALAAPDSAALTRRIETLEQALASAHAPRVSVLPTLTATDPGPTENAALQVLEANDARVAERPAPRPPQRNDRYWANDLTMRLGLTPTQAERLKTIQAELHQSLERQRQADADHSIPANQRRSARAAIRKEAEKQLRAVLSPGQIAAYEELDDRLKLSRPRDD